MRRLLFGMLILAVAFVFTATTVGAKEDLGELAKKEKARREAIKKQGKEAKVLTNDDVANIKSDIAIVGSEETPGTDTGVTFEPTETGGVTTDYDQQLRQLQEERDALKAQIDVDKGLLTGGTGMMSSNYGNQMQTVRGAEEKLAELDKKIQEVQEQKSKAESAKPETPSPQPETEQPPQE